MVQPTLNTPLTHSSHTEALQNGPETVAKRLIDPINLFGRTYLVCSRMTYRGDRSLNL